MSVCFSDSDLGDWTGDCASLDEVSLPSPEPDQPCGVDVILLATLPLDSYPLARHLVPMPRRIREQVLEVTKTVTLMEIVNSAPGKHPRSCEVTVTNIASDTGHPVSLKISHMHSAQNVDQNEAETQTPELVVTEITWDAIVRAPDGTTRIEQELETTVERIRPPRRKDKVIATTTTTFSRSSDNLIDLQFTQPVLPEAPVPADRHQRQQRSVAAFPSSSRPKIHTLYYRPFSEAHEVPGAARPAQPSRNGNQSNYPVDQQSLVMHESDLMTTDVSSNDGSLIIYSDARPRGRASSAEGFFTTVPNEETRSPTVRWFYAELDASRSSEEPMGKEVSRCAMNGDEKATNIVVSLRNDQKPCTSKSNGEPRFNRSSRSEPLVFKGSTHAKASNDGGKQERVESEASVSGRGEDEAENEDGVAGKSCPTPPLMTSTPYTTLERKDRSSYAFTYTHAPVWRLLSCPFILGILPNSPLPPPPSTESAHCHTIDCNQFRIHMETSSDGRELRQSHSVPTMLDSDDQQHAPVFEENDPQGGRESADHTPRKPPRSPIVVVNQSRKGSFDLLESERRTRKPTVTDIDWYAAFNMKEPNAPRSPLPNTVDVLKEAEAAGSHSHPLSAKRRHSDDKSLKPCDISMDEIFCTNSEKNSTKPCVCKACTLSKLSDEERIRMRSQPPERTRRVFRPESSPAEMSRSTNTTQPVDISLDDVFAVARSSSDEDKKEPVKSQSERPEAKEKVTFHLEKSSSSLPYSTSDIDLNDVFPVERKEVREQVKEEIKTSENHSQETKEIVVSVADSASMEEKPKQAAESLEWVAAMVGNSSDYKVKDEATVENRNISKSGTTETKEVHSNVTNSENPSSPRLSEASVAEKTTEQSRTTTAGEGEISGDWLRSLVEKEEKIENKPAPESTIPQNGGSLEGSESTSDRRKENLEKESNEKPQRTTDHSESRDTIHVSTVNMRMDSKDQEIPRQNVKSTVEEENPETIHFPPGRTLLVGDVLRKPSVLEETSFNIDHLSPISDVSRAYSQRLSQLRLQLGLSAVNDDEAGEEGSKSRDTSAPVERDHPESPKEVHGEDIKPMTDEALIDAVFRDVLEGEASEGTSLGAVSSSQDPNEGSQQDEKKAKLEKTISFEDWYEQPPPPSDDPEVKDYVDELLSQSMDEAIFSVSKTLRGKRRKDGRRPLLTDTSFDKKLLQEQAYESSDEKEQDEEKEKHDEDPIMKAVFTSSINNSQFMESVISYPSSACSPRHTLSAVTTPATAKTKDSADVFFSSSSTMNHDRDEVDVTYVSSASVVMNDTHSSSDGDFDEDHIIKLVFSEPNPRPTYTLSTERTTVDTVDRNSAKNPAAKPSLTSNSSVDSEEELQSFNLDDKRKLSDTARGENEMLEIEVFPDYFHIKGSYSLVISKDDPLGELLQRLQSTGTSSLDFSITPKLRRLLYQCIQEKALPSGGDLLSSRAKNLLTDEDPSDEVYVAMNQNRYNVETNPQGNINFCTAENNVCADELMSQLERKGFAPSEAHIVHYPPAGGHASTKRAVSRYFAEYMSAVISEDQLVILPSTTSAYDMLCHCTCESGNIVLTGAPTYAASVRNVSSRAECKIEPVEMDMNTPSLDILAYQKALDSHNAKGETVKAVLIINPHNPLGVIFPPEDVIRLCDWATRNNLMVLVDESFSSCVFASSAFKSFLCYRHRLEKPDNVVYMWSLSKDFGVPGMKISVVQSSSSVLLEALSRLELIHPVSALAHDAVLALLSDFDWLRKFHSMKLARLSDHYELLVTQLREIGLSFTPAVAGCFVMIDFRKHLRAQTFEDEMRLFKELCNRGVMLTPGQYFLCPQPGWMRLVFSCDKSELVEGINRLREFFKLPSLRGDNGF
ncbi:hypothetical protein Q1695_002386 [Nippostrongylus brasiliensis]|nr:hypothetical protein Q1695_002386 [Nippostrongylus brasiliensis]